MPHLKLDPFRSLGGALGLALCLNRLLFPYSHPIPSEETTRKNVKEIREKWKAEYAKDGVEDRARLRLMLLEEGKKGCSESPEISFAYFQEVLNLSVGCGDMPLALEAIFGIKAHFLADPYPFFLKAVEKFSEKYTAEPSRRLAWACLELSEQAKGDGEIQTGITLAEQAREFSQKAGDALCQKYAKELILELKVIVEAHRKASPAHMQLICDPQNAKASLAWGSFLAFYLGQWERGLPFLASGSEPQLRALAAKDLGGAKGVQDLRELGEGWWAAGEGREELALLRIKNRGAAFMLRAFQGGNENERASIEGSLKAWVKSSRQAKRPWVWSWDFLEPKRWGEGEFESHDMTWESDQGWTSDGKGKNGEGSLIFSPWLEGDAGISFEVRGNPMTGVLAGFFGKEDDPRGKDALTFFHWAVGNKSWVFQFPESLGTMPRIEAKRFHRIRIERRENTFYWYIDHALVMRGTDARFEPKPFRVMLGFLGEGKAFTRAMIHGFPALLPPEFKESVEGGLTGTKPPPPVKDPVPAQDGKEKLAVRIYAACDDQFQLFVNGKKLMGGQQAFQGTSLAMGDLICVKVESQGRAPRGFACVVVFDGSDRFIASGQHSWGSYVPRSGADWFIPSDADAMEVRVTSNKRVGQEVQRLSGVHCEAIWGDRMTSYLFLKVNERHIQAKAKR